MQGNTSSLLLYWRCWQQSYASPSLGQMHGSSWNQ